MKKLTKGLTLIELIIVIVIIAILVLISISYLRSQILKANDARRKGDLNRIKVAVEEYEKDHNCYPLPQLVTCSPGTGLQPYIDKIPCDPTTNASYVYDYDNSGACPAWYRIYTNLEDSSDPQVMAKCGPGGAFNFYEASSNSPDCNYTTQGGFYGCKAGLCVKLYWDNTRPGPECDPNYLDPTCYGRCGAGYPDCAPWHK